VEDAQEFVTRAVVFTLDPSPAQERVLASYVGAARFAFNWALGVVKDNLAARGTERDAGVPDEQLTPALSWSRFSLRKQFNAVKTDVAPWAGEVAKHCFDTGISNAATALKNWAGSKKGTRRGRRVGFPHFRSRRHPVQSVSFVELNHQLSWLHPSRHGVRLMLPAAWRGRSHPMFRHVGQLEWIHTVESARRLYKLVEQERATIQQVTIAMRGGRWQVSFLVRHQLARDVRHPKRAPRCGGAVGIDVGLKHLATLSQPVPGLTDEAGHVPNPQLLRGQLRRLRRLDRALARCEEQSNNRRKLQARRARLHGRVVKTRALHLHALTSELADRFDVLAIEDLNVAGMAGRKRRLGRSLADASLGELRRQLDYKTADRDRMLVTVDRWYPSSKTCSSCGAVKAKLHLWERVYECTTCGHVADRDVNAAHNLDAYARQFVGLAPRGAPPEPQQHDQHDVAGLRPETQNADPRSRKTRPAHAVLAAVA
jgi:putative transposase